MKFLILCDNKVMFREHIFRQELGLTSGGFTLLEMMLALAVVSIVVMGALQLTAGTVISVSSAAHLAVVLQDLRLAVGNYTRTVGTFPVSETDLTLPVGTSAFLPVEWCREFPGLKFSFAPAPGYLEVTVGTIPERTAEITASMIRAGTRTVPGGYIVLSFLKPPVLVRDVTAVQFVMLDVIARRGENQDPFPLSVTFSPIPYEPRISSGGTPLHLRYPVNTRATLVAPSTQSSFAFHSWLIDGRLRSLQNRITLDMITARSAVALYQ